VGRPGTGSAKCHARHRPVVPRDSPVPGARVVLALGTVFGLASLVRTAVVTPGEVALNFRVYYGAAEAFLAGGPLYGQSPVGTDWLVYLYPPLTVLAFVPFTLLPLAAAYVVFTALSVAGGLALAGVLIRAVERHGQSLGRVDRLLVTGFVVCGIYTVPSLVFGQVNLLLALAVAVGFVALASGRDRLAGSALGLAAFVKVFPAGFGLWLVRRRSWHAVGAAVATGGGLLAAGLVLGPAVTVAYVTEALLPRTARGAFTGGLGPNATFLTVRRPLSLLFPGSSVARTVGAVALLAPVVAVGCWRVDTTRRRLVATFTIVAGVLLALPSYPIYYVVLAYPLVPLLYLFEGPGRRLFTVGAALAMATVYLNDVRAGLTALGLPAPMHDALLSVLTPLLTVGTVPLYGFTLCLAGCLRYQVAGSRDGTSATRDRRASDER